MHGEAYNFCELWLILPILVLFQRTSSHICMRDRNESECTNCVIGVDIRLQHFLGSVSRISDPYDMIH